MIYLITNVAPKAVQVTFLDLLNGTDPFKNQYHSQSDTRVYTIKPGSRAAINLREHFPVQEAILKLADFNRNTEFLRQVPRESLYHSYKILKRRAQNKPKSELTASDWRPIDAPCKELSNAQNALKELLSSFVQANHHNAAYAYIENRDCKAAVAKHQRAGSNWFGDFDFHGFFPSTTLEWVMEQLSAIYPFNFICQNPAGYTELKKALELGFLRGGLPQGTKLSPWLTNLMMVPFDFEFSKKMRTFSDGTTKKDGTPFYEQFTYTRYADDICVSCKYSFNVKSVQQCLCDTLAEVHAPFTINPEKTKYGSKSGHNYRLGICLNQQGNLSIGYQKHKLLKADINNYICDKKAGKEWPLERLWQFSGNLSYFKNIEPDNFEYIVGWFNKKYAVDFWPMLCEDIKSKIA